MVASVKKSPSARKKGAYPYQMTVQDNVFSQAGIDSNIPMPAKRLPENSETSLLLNLQHGETFSRAERLPDGALGEEIQATTDRLSRAMSKPISRAKKRAPDHEYITSGGSFRTRSGDTIVCVAVTRIN